MSLQVLVNDPGKTNHGKNVDLAGDNEGRVRLAASPSWAGSTVTLDATGMAVGSGSYPGGVLLTNLDTTITVYISDTLTGLAAAATRYPLIPGINASVVVPFADLANIFAKGASGAPLLGLVAAS